MFGWKTDSLQLSCAHDVFFKDTVLSKSLHSFGCPLTFKVSFEKVEPVVPKTDAPAAALNALAPASVALAHAPASAATTSAATAHTPVLATAPEEMVHEWKDPWAD